MSVIHIKEPYWTAGRMYNYPGKPAGLGINLKLLEGEGNLEVRVGNSDKVWMIDKQIAKEFIRKYQSFFEAKGTKLGVIAWHMFISKEMINALQKTLF